MSELYLFAHEKSWVEQELLKVEQRLKELGLELGEAMDQSSETYHDNGPADAIRDEAGAYWQKRSWLLDLQTRRVKASPQQTLKIEPGHLVEIVSLAKNKPLTIYLGNIITSSNADYTQVSLDSPLYRALEGCSVGQRVEVAKNSYRVASIAV